MVEIIMNIKKYTAYFHDGALINIEQKNDRIELSLESSEVDPSDIDDTIKLTNRNTIKGKLYLNEVQSVQINDVPFLGLLEMKYDSANIFNFEIRGNLVELAVSWENFSPKTSVNDFSTIKITAKKMSWETIPDLFDPFW